MTRESIISIYNNSLVAAIKQSFVKHLKYDRFRSCNAYIAKETIVVRDSITDTWHTIRLIKSYNTVVAFYDETENCFCEIGKFSRTTSKQLTQIYNHYYGGKRVNANYINW